MTAVKAFRAAERELEKLRAEAHAAIIEDLRHGVRQADLVRATGYTREHLRQMAKDAGLPPARPSAER